ncbi:lysozyme [Ursidibacter arcticus]
MNKNQWSISVNGIQALKNYEALRTKAYLDDAKKWTIGYGHTGYVGNQPVGAGMVITEQQAEELLKQRLPEFEDAVRTSVKAPLTQNQYDALVSLAYNIGPNNFKNSTLVKKLNAGDVEGAAEQFMIWRNAGGKVNKGLINRRNREREMFLGVGEGEAPNIPIPTDFNEPIDSPIQNPKYSNPLSWAIPEMTSSTQMTTESQKGDNHNFTDSFNQLNNTLNAFQPQEKPIDNQTKYQKELAAAFGVEPSTKGIIPDYIGDMVRSIYDAQA